MILYRLYYKGQIGMNLAGSRSLCQNRSTLIKQNKSQHCDYMKTLPALLAAI